MTARVYRCILLDLGKVLVDFDLLEFARRILPRAGISAEQLRSHVMAGDLARKYETGVVGDAEFHGELCRRMKTDIPWDDFVQAWNAIFLAEPIIPQEIISSLSARAPLWIVSNTNKLHFDFIAARFDFLRYFQGWVLSHEVGAMKPDPRIFVHALQRAGAQAGETLFVDDQRDNVDSARRLGIDAFKFVDLDQFRRELTARELL